MTVRLALTVIGDEISPSLAEMISFCREHGVGRLDMRTVDGRNLLGMKLDEVARIGAALEGAGLRVPTYLSPLLKWPAPRKTPISKEVDFAFDPAQCPKDDALEYACDVAGILGATKMRVFSFLRHDGFHAKDALPAIERLMDLAGNRVTSMRLENAPACNVGSIVELAAFFDQLGNLLVNASDPRVLPVRPLLDIGNSYAMGVIPKDEDIARLAPSTDTIQIKDLRDSRAVPLGEGDIPWAKELERLLKDVTVPEVVASIETRCPDNPRDATARSVESLRRIAREIGVEIV